MEAPRTLRAFADRPGTGPGVIYRSYPSPARVSRSEANLTNPDENSRFATFAPGAPSSPSTSTVVRVDGTGAVPELSPSGSGVGRAVWLSPSSRSGDSEVKGQPGRPVTIFPAPRLAKARHKSGDAKWMH
eukprot:Skav200605  [mRNA]  locus=scaffold879:85977:88803:- [translate_table: standard]